jgi:hypothetical protein
LNLFLLGLYVPYTQLLPCTRPIHPHAGISPVCSSLITSMDVSFDFWYKSDEMQSAAWEKAYRALFGLFEHYFYNVRSLCLTMHMHMPAWEEVRGRLNDGGINDIHKSHR